MQTRRHNWIGILVIAVTASCFAQPAVALEIFGYRLFGSDDTPEGAIAYETTFTIIPPDEEIEDQLKGASLLETLSDTPPADMTALVSRAQADEQRLIGALYAAGYYGGLVTISVAGQPVSTLRPGMEPPAATPVPIEVRIEPGPEFQFGNVVIRQPRLGTDSPTSDPAEYGMRPGRRARSSIVIAAEERLVDAWRSRGHPLARIADREVVADHASRRLNVTLVIEPGPVAYFGAVTVEGTERMDPDFVRRQSGIEPGTRYSPEVVQKANQRLRALEVFQTVRVVEAESVGPTGALPITLLVQERPRRYVGAAASWSSIDGAEVNAYWGHRNLFGQAERLRIDATVSQLDNLDAEDYLYRLRGQFVKPGIIGIDTDLFSELTFFRERPNNDSYESYGGRAQIGLTHRFSEELTGSLGIEGQVSHGKDAFGSRDYKLIGLPGTLTLDRRDSQIDPTEGYRAALFTEPFVDVARGDLFSINRIDASAYVPLDRRRRMVLAGRVAFGTAFGANLVDIPPERRFYAGGGGSVRGYAYQNIGPRVDGDVVGGRSLVEGSAEFRARITNSIGLVPFIDVGAVSEDPFPGSDTVFKVGVGLGFRYYTAIGPIRFDAAVPLDPGKDDPDFAFYIGLGQAF